MEHPWVFSWDLIRNKMCNFQLSIKPAGLLVGFVCFLVEFAWENSIATRKLCNLLSSNQFKEWIHVFGWIYYEKKTLFSCPSATFKLYEGRCPMLYFKFYVSTSNQIQFPYVSSQGHTPLLYRAVFLSSLIASVLYFKIIRLTYCREEIWLYSYEILSMRSSYGWRTLGAKDVPLHP